MGNPAYDARREAERLEHEKDRAAAEAAKQAFEGITAFFNGRASITLGKTLQGDTIIRFNRG